MDGIVLLWLSRLLARQQCRLTICIELDELTNSIRQQDPNDSSDTETRCLVYVQGHFYWAPPEAVSWWGFSWMKGSQIVCRGHLSHPKTLFWYTKCGIVFNHLYEAVSDQDPVWVRSEEKIPSGFESTPNIIFSMPQSSLVTQLSEKVWHVFSQN